MVETREHDLARMAIEECMRVVEFGDQLILTDQPEKFGPHVASESRFHYVPDWPEKIGWSRAWWFDVPPLLKTSHTLNIQWDSWICDVSQWTDEFLNYDYIGAPWWYKDGKNVGNGGFSLISTRLKKYIYDRKGEYPCDTAVDDDLLCRKYRQKLEDAGFTWAPEKLAHRFAFECCRVTPASFGFHAMFNWPKVLAPERLEDRMKIAMNSPYIRDGYMMKAFRANNPEILEGHNG